jgi:predicted Zn-dependent peptidase
MSAIVYRTILPLAILMSAAGVQAQEVERVQFDVQKRTLENGVRVLVLERPNIPGRVGARIFYQSDVAGERPGTIGLTHMLEHHLLYGGSFVHGTESWEEEREIAWALEQTARELTDELNRVQSCLRQREVFEELERACSTPRLEALRARYDQLVERQDRLTDTPSQDRGQYMAGGATGLTGSTSSDWLKFDADLPADRLELFMWLERSKMDRPVFRTFDPEKDVVIEQIRSQFNQPAAPFNRALRSLTYEANPYGWSHWFSDLEGATREDHWEIYHKMFIPQNTILVVVGDVRPESVFALAERYWGDWPPARPAPRLRTVEPVPAGQRRLISHAATGPQLAVNVQTPAVGHADLPALEVLAEVLNGPRGHLMQRLGGTAGPATYASANVRVARYPAHFSIRVGAPSNEALTEVERGLESAIERIAGGAIGAEEIEAAVRRLVFEHIMALDEPGPAAVRLGHFETIHGWSLANELPELWAAVTPADVSRVARRYFEPRLWVVGELRREEANPTSDPARSWPSDRWGEAQLASALMGPAEPPPVLLPHEELAAGRWQASPPLQAPAVGDPLPVAENVWFAAPWMAVRRSMHAETANDRPARISDIRFPETPAFVPPDPRRHVVQAPGRLPVFFVRDAFLPRVQISLFLDIQPLDDPAGKEGLSEVALELLLAGGTRDLPGSAFGATLDALNVSMSSLVEARGARLDGHRARIDLLAPASAAEEAVRLLGAVVAHAGGDEGEFERARSRVAARAAATGGPSERLNRIFASAAFAGHPLGRVPTRESVESIGYADVRSLLEAALTGSRMAVAISGAADQREVEQWVRSAFAGTSRGRAVRRAPVPASPAVAPRVVTADMPTAQAFVKLGYGLDDDVFRNPREHAAFELMNYILCGAGQGSRLFQRLRTERGYTAAVYCEMDPRESGPAVYEFRFAGVPNQTAAALQETCEILEDMRTGGLTQVELERARTAYLKGHVPSMYRTGHHAAMRFAEQALMGRFDYERTYYLNYYAGGVDQMNAVRRVTLDEVNAAARRYVRPEAAMVGIVGPLDAVHGGAGQRAIAPCRR